MSAWDILAKAPRGTKWVELRDAWKCILPGRATEPGKAQGRTPLEALAAALEGR